MKTFLAVIFSSLIIIITLGIFLWYVGIFPGAVLILSAVFAASISPIQTK